MHVASCTFLVRYSALAAALKTTAEYSNLKTQQAFWASIKHPKRRSTQSDINSLTQTPKQDLLRAEGLSRLRIKFGLCMWDDTLVVSKSGSRQ